MVPNCQREEGDKLCDPGGPRVDIGVQPPEVLKGLVDALGEGDSRLACRGQGVLHLAEEVARPWHGKGHAAKFPQDLVPLLDGRAFLRERNAG